jgi:teneurin
MVCEYKYSTIPIRATPSPTEKDCKSLSRFPSRHGASSLRSSFNLLINGGGSVIIQFVRQPFKSKQSAFIVPWNTFLHVGYIFMDENQENVTCQRNLSRSVEPQLWDTSLDYAYTLGSQIIRKSISIDHNDLPIRFVYLSSSSNRRYQSILTVVLTSNEIDDYLLQIHLSISIEGIYFLKQFHAKRNLTYEYEWSRRNAYDQNVHGLAEAIGTF